MEEIVPAYANELIPVIQGTGRGVADNNLLIPVKRFDNSGYIDILLTILADDAAELRIAVPSM